MTFHIFPILNQLQQASIVPQYQEPPHLLNWGQLIHLPENYEAIAVLETKDRRPKRNSVMDQTVVYTSILYIAH